MSGNVITCSGCDATWTGLTTCHCAACHRTFAGVWLFDKQRHPHGEHGGCLDPAELRNGRTGEPLAVLGADGNWNRPPMPADAVARLKAARART